MQEEPAVGPAADDDARVREFLLDQLRDSDRIAAAIGLRLAADLPIVADLPEPVQAERLAWFGEMSRAAFAAMVDGRDLAELAPQIEEMARQRKDQGISLDHILKSVEVGIDGLLDHFHRELQGHPDESILLHRISRRLMELQRVFIAATTVGFRPAPSQQAEREAGLQAVLDLAVGRRGSDLDDDPELVRRLGLHLPPRLVTVSTAGPDAREAALATSRMNHWDVVGVLDDRVVALTARPCNSFTSPRGTAEVPEDAASYQVAVAYEQAASAADVAAQLGIDELAAPAAAPLAAMLGLPQAQRDAFVAATFGDLPATQRGRSLLAAVAAALTHGRLADAAASLHVHRHTLDYRLRRFTEQTGLDVNEPVARLQSMIALFLLGMLAPGATAEG